MKRREYLSLKGRLRELVDHVKVGGVNAAARLTGISSSQMSSYCSPNSPAQLGCGHVVALEKVAGVMLVTGRMAHLQGAIVLKLPEHDGEGIDVHHAHVAGQWAEVSKAIIVILTRGNRATKDEIRRAEREYEELLSLASNAMAVLRARLG